MISSRAYPFPHPAGGAYHIHNFCQEDPYRASDGWLYICVFGTRQARISADHYGPKETGFMIWRWRDSIVEDVSPLIPDGTGGLRLPRARGSVYPDRYPGINQMCAVIKDGDFPIVALYWYPLGFSV